MHIVDIFLKLRVSIGKSARHLAADVLCADVVNEDKIHLSESVHDEPCIFHFESC